MKQIIFTIIFLVFSHLIHAQNTSKHTVFDFLKGIKYQSIEKRYFVDSSCVLIVIKEVNSNRLCMYNVEINDEAGTFITKKLAIKHADLLNIPEIYFKIKNEIIRISREQNKKDENAKFYIEKFNGVDFVKSDTPFFTGNKTEFSSFSSFSKFGNYIRMTAYNDEFGYSKVKYLFFDVSDFTLKSTIILPFNEEQNIRFVDRPFVLNDKVFNFYSLIDSKTKKRKYELTILDGFEIKQIEFENFPFRDSVAKNVTFFHVNNKYYLHMLLRNKSTWENIICSIDIKKQTSTIIEQSEVKKESLYKEISYVFKPSEFEQKYLNDDVYMQRWQTITDGDEVYIVFYFTEYVNGILDRYLFLTKISNENVEWSSLLNRAPRNSGVNYLSANILEDSLVIADIEDENKFDKNGNWVFDKSSISSLGYIPVTLNINKENGNCKRELIKLD